MADEKSKGIGAALEGLGRLPIQRQIGIWIGIAANIALAVGLYLWAQQPGYRTLYSGLSEQDSGEITAALQQANIPYRIAEESGAVQVPGAKVHESRLKLAAQGLPKGAGVGFEILDKEQGFGTSEFMESARYHRALEGELSRTISTLSTVKGARVHLAIPKQSAFLRDRELRQPSASVMLTLFGGRRLEEGQVAAIVHMVSSSIPNLEPSRVTIVDQTGQLLTSNNTSAEMQLSSSQFEYRRRLEDYYIKRIEAILSPIAGINGVKAQVVADIDFSTTEQTQESYNPDLPSVRSEQTFEDQSSSARIASGVPGAASNQPPGAAAPADTANPAQNSTKRVTRNYELDKTISHTSQPSGSVRRLSVAVVVDDRQTLDENGEVQREPLSEEEVNRITTLVKEAVGFSAQRGDSVNVINASFAVPPEAEPLPETSFFSQPWLWDLIKQVLVVLVAVFLGMSILRPLLRSLADRAVAPQPLAVQGAYPQQGMMTAEGEQLMMSPQQAMGQLSGPANYEQQINTARTMVNQDPKRVAQVVKTWVASDGG